jgi:hypothetical protein
VASRKPSVEQELERVREWKRVGMALAAACASYETILVAQAMHIQEQSK